MTTRLIIARHGNTFEEHETPRRVGVGTNLPLTDTGWSQARALGVWMREHGLFPDAAFSSRLMRARDTAAMALVETGQDLHIQEEAIFNEIDYGSDENKTEAEVIARIGAQALKDWDEHATPPSGWDVDPAEIIQNWRDFGARIAKDYKHCTVLVVTSNGIARFAPYLTGDFEAFRQDHSLKIATGALCLLENEGDPDWTVRLWNVRPWV